MHPGHPGLDLGLDQPLELLAQEVLHGDLVGLHLLEVFEQSTTRADAETSCDLCDFLVLL